METDKGCHFHRGIDDDVPDHFVGLGRCHVVCLWVIGSAQELDKHGHIDNLDERDRARDVLDEHVVFAFIEHLQ